jgi:glutamate synthase (NADPH/NADH) large chain
MRCAPAASVIVLTDREVPKGRAAGADAVRRRRRATMRLIDAGQRCNAQHRGSETASARDPHHYACLIGYGATAVYPWLAYQVVAELIVRSGRGQAAARTRRSPTTARAWTRACYKILSKMGISAVVELPRRAAVRGASACTKRSSSWRFKGTVVAHLGLELQGLRGRA